MSVFMCVCVCVCLCVCVCVFVYVCVSVSVSVYVCEGSTQMDVQYLNIHAFLVRDYHACFLCVFVPISIVHGNCQLSVSPTLYALLS